MSHIAYHGNDFGKNCMNSKIQVTPFVSVLWGWHRNFSATVIDYILLYHYRNMSFILYIRVIVKTTL